MLWWVIYLTNRLHFPVCVCTVIDHRWRYSLERTKKYDTRQSRVAALLFITRCDVFSDLLQYTHMEKCNLFVLYNKNSNGLLKDFGGIGILGFWGLHGRSQKNVNTNALRASLPLSVSRFIHYLFLSLNSLFDKAYFEK